MKIGSLITLIFFAAQLAIAADPSPFELHLVADVQTETTKAYSLPPRNGQTETVLLDSTILLDHTAVKSVSLGRDPATNLISLGKSNIQIELTKAAQKKFGDITTKNVGNRLGIVLNGQLVCAPVVRDAIWGGSLTITGNFTEAETAELVKKLNQSIVK